MRFINCPNCLSSHADDRLEPPSTIAAKPLNHRNRSRLYSITKALFSPMHSFTTPNKPTHNGKASNKHQSKRQKADMLCANLRPKYPIERWHKVKKRDLVQRNRRASLYDDVTGKQDKI